MKHIISLGMLFFTTLMLDAAAEKSPRGRRRKSGVVKPELYVGVVSKHVMEKQSCFPVVQQDFLNRPDQLLLGMFYGSGSPHAADYAAKKFPGELAEQFKVKGKTDADVQCALQDTVRKIDADFNKQFIRALDGRDPQELSSTQYYRENGGESEATALAVLLHRSDFFLAHLGDLRALIVLNKTEEKKFPVIQITTEHTADSPREIERLKNAGIHMDSYKGDCSYTTRFIGGMRHKPTYGKYFLDFKGPDAGNSIEAAIAKGMQDDSYRALVLMCCDTLEYLIQREIQRRIGRGEEKRVVQHDKDGLNDAANERVAELVLSILDEPTNNAQDAAEALVRYTDNAQVIVLDFNAWKKHFQQVKSDSKDTSAVIISSEPASPDSSCFICK